MSPFFLISEPFQYTKGSGKGFSKVVTGQFSARLRRALACEEGFACLQAKPSSQARKRLVNEPGQINGSPL